MNQTPHLLHLLLHLLMGPQHFMGVMEPQLQPLDLRWETFVRKASGVKERGLEPPRSSSYLFQVLVREQQILILLLQEQQPQFVHLQRRASAAESSPSGTAMGQGAPLPPCQSPAQ